MKILDVKVYLGANPSTCSMRVARALLVHPREITLALERLVEQLATCSAG